MVEHFDAARLDPGRWVPHYLPHWSSRAASAAAYELAGSELRLRVRGDHPVWCAEEHDPPLRVSGIQSGVFSGPAGGTVGQQPFKRGLTVSEEQPALRGWLVEEGRIDVRARMTLGPRSMASVWMVGFEDEPHRCGEICVFEVFGAALEPGSAAVGMGVHPFRDPDLTDDFEAVRLPIDVAEHHVYTADWRDGRVDFLVDGAHVRSVEQAPAYPLQFMVAVFDFPAQGPPDPVEPELAVDLIAVR